jgi:membrane fusion protein (multidrug efflux system)
LIRNKFLNFGDKMKKIINLFVFGLTLSVSLLTISCGDSEGSEQVNNNTEPTVYVKTMKLKSESFVDYISLLGVAKAFYHSNLSSEEGGKIKEFVKNKGSFVRKGEVILELENEVLKSNMDANKAQYDMAENNYSRQEQIYKEKVISELQFLNSKYERDAAKANYELIKARYERTFIKAPFTGIVDARFAEIGEMVLPGSPVVSVVSMYKIKLKAGVPENYVNMVKKGDSVKVVFKDLDNSIYNEKVSYVGNTISTDNRTFPIEINIDNRDGKIKPELSAQVFIHKEKFSEAIVIPEETVIKTDLGYVVFVEEDGVARMRVVEIISRSNNRVALRSGVKEGENLITVGFQSLVDKTKIKVVND